MDQLWKISYKAEGDHNSFQLKPFVNSTDTIKTIAWSCGVAHFKVYIRQTVQLEWYLVESSLFSNKIVNTSLGQFHRYLILRTHALENRIKHDDQTQFLFSLAKTINIFNVPDLYDRGHIVLVCLSACVCSCLFVCHQTLTLPLKLKPFELECTRLFTTMISNNFQDTRSKV